MSFLCCAALVSPPPPLPGIFFASWLGLGLRRRRQVRASSSSEQKQQPTQPRDTSNKTEFSPAPRTLSLSEGGLAGGGGA
eukprot:scaffold72664_cov57-Phaeocystis_antarctica.AAC.2